MMTDLIIPIGLIRHIPITKSCSKFARTFAVFSVLLLLSNPAVQAATIEIPYAGTSTGIFESNAGLVRNRSLGQTFVVPNPVSENILRRLSFSLFAFANEDLLSQDFDFSARVYQFDDATKRVIGPALFDSGPQVLIPPESAGTVKFTFTPNIVLSSATKYIAFVSTQGGENDNDSRTSNNTPSNIYADGTLAVQFGSGIDPQWETDPWQVDFSVDMGGFEAEFAATVPVPPAIALFAAPLLGLLGLHRRYRPL